MEELSQLCRTKHSWISCSFPLRSGNLSDWNDKNNTIEVQGLVGQTIFVHIHNQNGSDLLELLDLRAGNWGGGKGPLKAQ